MDPDETLRQLFNAVGRKDHEQTKELAEALRNWILKCGFTPQVSDYQLRILLVGYAKHVDQTATRMLKYAPTNSDD